MYAPIVTQCHSSETETFDAFSVAAAAACVFFLFFLFKMKKKFETFSETLSTFIHAIMHQRFAENRSSRKRCPRPVVSVLNAERRTWRESNESIKNKRIRLCAIVRMNFGYSGRLKLSRLNNNNGEQKR